MPAPNIAFRHQPCDNPPSAPHFFRGRHHRQRGEPKPGTPVASSIAEDSHSFIPSSSPLLTVRHRPTPYSTGVPLSTIRSLSRRGRFPTNGHYLSLSMTNEMAHFINYRVDSKDSNKDRLSSPPDHPRNNRRVDVVMLCFKTKTDPTPTFELPLTGAMMVARTCSGSGPCIYLRTTVGTFEFQCQRSGRQQQHDYHFWEAQMRSLGVKIVLPQDLFATTSNDPVGEGSFAQVYSATHKTTGRSVVIKRVPKEKLSNLPENHPSAVHIEIDVLRRIYHPFIVQFQTAFEDDLHYFIVLERLMGGNVYEWLRSHRAYTEQQARGAMFRVLAALAALEQESVVHRDLKLENLVLENPNDPTSIKLIDFGLAAFLDTPRMTMHCGSPGFVAPEIIGKHAYGCRADMFSAGVFLYSVLCGKFPFHSDGDTASETLTKNERCEVSFEAPQWRNISNDAKDLITRLLTKDPAIRLSAAQAMTHRWMIGRIPHLPFCDPYGNNNDPSSKWAPAFFQQFPPPNSGCYASLSPRALQFTTLPHPPQFNSNHQQVIIPPNCCVSHFPPIPSDFRISSPNHMLVDNNIISDHHYYHHAAVTRLALLDSVNGANGDFDERFTPTFVQGPTFASSSTMVTASDADKTSLLQQQQQQYYSLSSAGERINCIATHPLPPHDGEWGLTHSTDSRSTSVSCFSEQQTLNEHSYYGQFKLTSHLDYLSPDCYCSSLSSPRSKSPCYLITPSSHSDVEFQRRLNNQLLIEQSL